MKNRWIVHFKYMNYMLCELYLNFIFQKLMIISAYEFWPRRFYNNTNVFCIFLCTLTWMCDVYTCNCSDLVGLWTVEIWDKVSTPPFTNSVILGKQYNLICCEEDQLNMKAISTRKLQWSICNPPLKSKITKKPSDKKKEKKK